MNHDSSNTEPSLTMEERVASLSRLSPDQLREVDRILSQVPNHRFLSTAQVLRLLGISRATLQRRIARGQLRSLPIHRKRNVFMARDVMALLHPSPENTHEQ